MKKKELERMKKKHAVHLQKKQQILTSTNRCGECRACCNIMGVEELQKPYYCNCEHLNNGGCAIYANRPPSCRGFGCKWRLGIFDLSIQEIKDKYKESGRDENWWETFSPQSIEFRPDKLGVMFTIDDLNEGICGYKVRPDNIDMDKVNEALEILRKKFPTMVRPVVTLYEYDAKITVPFATGDKYLVNEVL